MDIVSLQTEAFALSADQTTSFGVPEPATRESRVVRTMNVTMRELSGSLARSEAIGFFCECANAACFSVVWMTPCVFDRTIAGHTGWMLLDGHEPSALWHTRAPAPLPVTSRAPRAVDTARRAAPNQIRRQWRVPLERRLARAS
jgi:hypothetical protein